MSKLYRARSLLYRRQILQENIRWKALDEIYKIYMLLHRSDLNISANVRQTFSHFSANFANMQLDSYSVLLWGRPLSVVILARYLFNESSRYVHRYANSWPRGDRNFRNPGSEFIFFEKFSLNFCSDFHENSLNFDEYSKHETAQTQPWTERRAASVLMPAKPVVAV